MKKVTPAAAAGPAYYRMLNRRFHSKQTGSSTKETITYHFFVSELGRRKLSIQPNLWRRRNVVKTETQQTFVNGLLGFITLGICYSAGSVCVCHVIA